MKTCKKINIFPHKQEDMPSGVEDIPPGFEDMELVGGRQEQQRLEVVEDAVLVQ